MVKPVIIGSTGWVPLVSVDDLREELEAHHDVRRYCCSRRKGAQKVALVELPVSSESEALDTGKAHGFTAFPVRPMRRTSAFS